MPSEQAPDHLFQLTKEQREFYHTEGYLVIDNFYSKTQSENLAKLVEELAAWPEVSGKYMKYPQEADTTIVRSWCVDKQWVPLECKAGSIVIFGSYLAHRSGPNESSKSRRLIYLTYNSQNEGDKHDMYYEDKRKLFPPKAEREPGKDYSKGALIYNVGTPIID